MLSRIPLASKTVLVGGLAAVSLTVTGVALAVPGGPFSPAADSTTTSASPTDTPSEDTKAMNVTADDSTESPEPAETESPEPSESPKADRTCPWPTPTAVASAATAPTTAPGDEQGDGQDDNGLHCGWFKPGSDTKGSHENRGHDGKGDSQDGAKSDDQGEDQGHDQGDDSTPEATRAPRPEATHSEDSGDHGDNGHDSGDSSHD